MKLKDKSLPWVTAVKHLGTTLTNDIGCKTNQDLAEKRAAYISKNNELVQEFHYAHRRTLVLLNLIYNTCFYGSPLWDMSSRNFEKLENSWNVSHRIMLSIPRTAHRYLIEPLSEKRHIIKSLRKRFLSFLLKVRLNKKNVLRNILREIEHDCLSTSGKNLRKIRLHSGNFCDENIDFYKEPYQEVPNDAEWRMPLVNEILAIKAGELVIENLSYNELDCAIESVCST